MSTQYTYFVDRFGKTREVEWLKPDDRLSRLHFHFCSTCGVFNSAALLIILIGRLQNTSCEHSLDWSTQFCLSRRLSGLSTTPAELAKTCFSWTVLHENFTCHLSANTAVSTDHCRSHSDQKQEVI